MSEGASTRTRKGGGGSSRHPRGVSKSGSFNEEHVKLSKKLSAVLRHRIAENGLTDVLRPDGFVPLSRLLATPGFRGVGIDQIKSIVESNDKQRFSISEEDGQIFIRANQGHTSSGIDESQLLERMDEDALRAIGAGRAVHGTYRAAWKTITSSGGLSPMSRHHVHLAADLPGESGVISGMRASAEIHIWVDMLAASRAGIPFFRSANGVILTPGLADTRLLPSNYFHRVLDPQRNLEWRDGEWQAAAPAAAAAAAVAAASSAADAKQIAAGCR